ncbi:MAG: SPOR domain-containing protein [Candidatus Omnitrophica bacterium]|nr:SPOR domain-containing protein [Candidatus Omnitrophota bacterium]
MEKQKEQAVSSSKEKQGEFFSEFQPSDIKKPAYFFRQDFLLRKKINLDISYENFVLAFIVFIMLLVVFFSLGVERGKRVALTTSSPRHAANVEAFYNRTGGKESEEKAPETAVNAVHNQNEALLNVTSAAAPDNTALVIDSQVADTTPRPYTIQVIAFKKEENAKKEMERLASEGYDVFSLPSPSKEWIQVCVGRYISKDESKRDLETLQKRYPSSYVRKIQN